MKIMFGKLVSKLLRKVKTERLFTPMYNAHEKSGAALDLFCWIRKTKTHTYERDFALCRLKYLSGMYTFWVSNNQTLKDVRVMYYLRRK